MRTFNPEKTIGYILYDLNKALDNINIDDFMHADVELPKNKALSFMPTATECFQDLAKYPKSKIAIIKVRGDIQLKNGYLATNKFYVLRDIFITELFERVNFESEMNNSGHSNLGKYNKGSYNWGDNNKGDNNKGHNNFGDTNIGDNNLGNNNCGYHNSGDCNYGSFNFGDSNDGDYNLGDYNYGYRNVGDFNKCDDSNGCFNTSATTIHMFNKPTTWTLDDWHDSKAYEILLDMPSSYVLPTQFSTYPPEPYEWHYSRMGIPVLEWLDRTHIRQDWWDSLPAEHRRIVMDLPNFDKDIFKEITGIHVSSIE